MKKLFITCAMAFCCCTSSFAELSIDDVQKSAKNEDYSDKDSENLLYIYVGIDYIPQEIVKLFEEVSGIKVVISIFDSNETLEAKMLAGGAQYDIVFPTAFPCFSRQLKAKIYKKIDKSKIDLAKFDSYVIKKIKSFDIENEYCIPYQWGISGLGVREDIIKKAIPNAQFDSYGLIFDEENIKKLSEFGVSVYESHEELFPAVAAYLGFDPENMEMESVRKATEHLKKIRKYIRKFTGYGFEDLSSGNACIVLGTSGDIVSVRNQELANFNKSHIQFVFPKEGASLWIDVAAIPQDAKHVKNAHLFMKFLMNPHVSAYIVNSTCRATALDAAKEHIDKDIVENEYIFPNNDIKMKCYLEKYQYGPLNKIRTKEFTKLKSKL